MIRPFVSGDLHFRCTVRFGRKGYPFCGCSKERVPSHCSWRTDKMEVDPGVLLFFMLYSSLESSCQALPVHLSAEQRRRAVHPARQSQFTVVCLAASSAPVTAGPDSMQIDTVVVDTLSKPLGTHVSLSCHAICAYEADALVHHTSCSFLCAVDVDAHLKQVRLVTAHIASTVGSMVQASATPEQRKVSAIESR